MVKAIQIRGARQHNLRGVDLDLPRDRLVVITGVSGSGKSSLAFDTIYAEGQRRYVESLSVHARQFLERMDRPDVDQIDGLSPAISIEQKGLSKNPRSTVATLTEIHDHLRLLYCRVGQPHCPDCDRPLSAMAVQQMVDRVLALPEGARFSVLAPLAVQQRGGFVAELAELRKQGFSRVAIDGELRDLAEEIALDSEQPHDIDLYVDRLVRKDKIRSRLYEAIELALRLADGQVKIDIVDPLPDGLEEYRFSNRLVCRSCDRSLDKLTPQLFSFNSPHGACAACSGLGALYEFDAALIVPDRERSLRDGAIEPWEQRPALQAQLEALAEELSISPTLPFAELPESAQRLILFGDGKLTAERQPVPGSAFEGVIPQLQRRFAERQRRRRDGRAPLDGALSEIDDAFAPYMVRKRCPACGGQRLKPQARAVRLAGRTLPELCALTVEQAQRFFAELQLAELPHRPVAEQLIGEIDARLRFLNQVGLHYLSLDRTVATLSGGEGQRVRLATQIGSALVGVLYILDEPSIGLHQRDHQRLLETLKQLRDLGNTVILVEHDEETIRAADYLVDLGPGAGKHGGCVVSAGPPEQVAADKRSITGQFLCGARSIAVPISRRRSRKRIELKGATHNNLQGIDIAIPRRALTCVTGVSGSGKSSLIVDTLLPAVRARLEGRAADDCGAFSSLEGVQGLEKVIAVDQQPIGRTPRSNPASYVGLFTAIRELFAQLPEARARGYKAGRFSFNVRGGRCEACRGEGAQRVEMHFLPDIHVQCELCGGSRYNRETLAVKYKGLDIAEVLALTVDDAAVFFANVPRLRERLELLIEVGLGYLCLGQAANTLSGGEAQRIKLARELSRKTAGDTLYILDEPTTGLHFADIEVLLGVLDRLVQAGHTVVVIEHHLDVIKSADFVIDLGPEGGDRGGRLVISGTPEQVAACTHSPTGAVLARVLP
ncbi:MAG: excinuclease ABC subunit UvrA [Deltaproteobacteria bacterium]|nr:excinuclease ABC subunit UvrA [Deltaproteobacteria bacterium]